jgi:hypothetical protein
VVAGASGLTGWLAIVAIAAALTVGVWLRRFKDAPPLVRRMRPHYVFGYCALAFAAVHTFLAMGAVAQAGMTGITFATAALCALAFQTFIGASLQDPGGYRKTLRAWHLATIAALAVTLAVHVTLDGGLAL